MTRPARYQLLTVDEARALIAATAINLVDTYVGPPGRLGHLLDGHGTRTNLPPPAAAAARAHRAAIRHLDTVGLAWVIDDELDGVRSYAGIPHSDIVAA